MKVVVIGGGFGGLSAAGGLAEVEGIEVTLVDKRNFHLFQPLLYQVATGGLSPANIASPLRGIFSGRMNVRVVLDEVTGFDLENKQVHLLESRLDYDVLIVATGSQYNYFGHPEWEEFAPSLKTLEDATLIRGRILRAFEEAEVAETPEDIAAWMTFIVIGGGPTGVEMAGAIAELAKITLPGDFRKISASRAHIILLEADGRILGPYPESLSRKAVESLNKLGAEVRVNARVTDIDENGVTIQSGDQEERLPARTVIWAAGVVGTPIGKKLAEAAGQELGPSGRLRVTPELSLPGHPDVFVIGDLAYLEQKGKPIPALAPVAMQQGSYMAKSLAGRLKGERPRPFKYRDRGTMATIGRSAAVADLGFIKLHGFIGWVTWLFVHLMMLVHFQNRVLVFIQWAWNYITHGRSARLITGRIAERRIDPHEAEQA